MRAEDLVNADVPGGAVTEAGVRNNINVALQYLSAWLSGTGAAAIHNLMEDAATAEISRAQLWQWRTHGATLEGGERVSEALYRRLKDEELASLQGAHLETAAELLDHLVLNPEFETFLTLRAYAHLD